MGVDLESVSEATSGAIGSLLSTTILYPLDTCKTKYQAEARAHGLQKYRKLTDVLWEAISTRQVLSLYQGLGTKNLQSFISQFVYFYGYSYFKRLYLKKSGSKHIGTKVNLVIAAAAGACTAVVTQPLDTASSRMQTSAFGKSKGLWETLTEGRWSDAFDGLGISLLLTSNPAIQYTVFDQLKQKLLKTNKNNAEKTAVTLSAFSAFVLGALSKSIATFLTYPAIRCKVVIQAADSDDDETKKAQRKSTKTLPAVICAIWKREGILGFFKGLHAQILKTVLSSALLLMIKEKITKTTWVLILGIRSFKFSFKVVAIVADNQHATIPSLKEMPELSTNYQAVLSRPKRSRGAQVVKVGIPSVERVRHSVRIEEITRSSHYVSKNLDQLHDRMKKVETNIRYLVVVDKNTRCHEPRPVSKHGEVQELYIQLLLGSDREQFYPKLK
ncbi:unnamed protein product [Dovyalis caffra]|uniref:Peroxisomal adenine nucleotide carrier 1 n=1 Tax=Dovyalis caffra TaxID=77055 RepID=A0AAV1RVL6_9ROSI|nr:unnamed protein product [Dovyalis caffra]